MEERQVLQHQEYKIDEKLLKEADLVILNFPNNPTASLKDHPEWLEELRKLILTYELLELPKKFNEFVEKEFKPLKKKVERIEQKVEKLEQDVDTLKQDVAILKQDVEKLKQDVNYLKGEFGRYKGWEFERSVREKAPAYFGRILRKTKVIPLERIAEILDEAEDRGKINEEERLEVLNIDVVIKGEIRQTRKPVILAVEVSYQAFEDDIERALKRYKIFQKLFEEQVIPTVVSCEVKEEIEKLAEEKGVLLIKVKY